MWWYQALHAELLGTLASASATTGSVLDAGCGTGGFLRRLAARLPARPRFGVEIMQQAAGLAAARSQSPVCVGSVNALPVAEGGVAAVVSADVLCHGQVNEAQALAEFRRVLAPGGLLVLNLPAFRWMESAHDRAVHNTRRYTRPQVEAMLRQAGFRIARVRYWNSLLFPLMVVQRKLLARNAAASDVHLFPAPVEALFRAVTLLERLLPFSLPFGGSVLAVAHKP